MSRAGNPENLRAAARRKSEAKVASVEEALRDLVRLRQAINFRSVATKAGCSTAFLYANHDLRTRIERLRDQQRAAPKPQPASVAASDSPSNVVRALSFQLAEVKRRNREEVAELREALAVAQGEVLELRQRLARTPVR